MSIQNSLRIFCISPFGNSPARRFVRNSVPIGAVATPGCQYSIIPPGVDLLETLVVGQFEILNFVIPNPRQRASVFISLRVGVRDLAFPKAETNPLPNRPALIAAAGSACLACLRMVSLQSASLRKAALPKNCIYR